MFEEVEFLLGNGESIVIVIPAALPRAQTYTVTVTNDNLKFRADSDEIAMMAYPGGEIYQRLVRNSQVGLVEYTDQGHFPNRITNLAYVEVKKG